MKYALLASFCVLAVAWAAFVSWFSHDGRKEARAAAAPEVSGAVSVYTFRHTQPADAGPVPETKDRGQRRVHVLGVGVNTGTAGGFDQGNEDDWYDEVVLCIDVLERELCRVYSGAYVKKLVGDDATRQNLERTLAELAAVSVAGDLTVIYLGTHGSYNRSGVGFAVSVYGGQVCSRELTAWLKRVKGTVILFLDTCHAGGFLKDGFEHPDAVVIPVCRHDQSAYCWQFAKPLALGLTGSADADGNGEVTLSELTTYCKDYLSGRRKAQTLISDEVTKSKHRGLVLARR